MTSPDGARRLTAGLEQRPRLDLEGHEATHGALPAAGRDPEPLLRELSLAGLSGRGGAAFPMAKKLETLARRRSGRFVVANGSEGEPMSRKDRFLLESAPHLVLDGAVTVARAIGAKEIVVSVAEDAAHARTSIEAAVAERRDTGAIRVAGVPRRYLSGEESALLQYLGGGPLAPTISPPRPVDRGLDGRPTLINNVETLAHVALIARHGGEWFRSLGAAEAPGTALVTLSGAIERPGVYEISTGTPLARVLEAAGGATEAPRAFLVGGYFGAWLDGETGDGIALDPVGLGGHGAALGAGVIVVLGQSACPAAEAARSLAWLSGESAGQCGPCVFGLTALSEGFGRLVTGRADNAEYDRLVRWAGEIEGRGACHHPNGVVRLLRSGLDVFAAEIADHHRHGPCEACDLPPVLLTPGTRVLVS
jgi:NADH:ubiquinone oxidoreductase subunit F (NADH-binding)